MDYLTAALLVAVSLGIFQVMMKVTMEHISAAVASFTTLTVNALFIWVLYVATTPGLYFVNSAVVLFAVAGVLAPGIGRPLLFLSIQKLGATIASALINIYPIFVIGPAILLLGEYPSFATMVGMVLIVVGIMVFQFEVSMKGTSAGSVLGRMKNRAVMIPIAAAILTGISFAIRKDGLLMLNSPTFGAAVSTTAGSVVSLGSVAKSRGEKRDDNLSIRSRFVLLLLVGALLNSITWVLDFTATSLGDVVKVAPIEATAPIFTFTFTWIFLRQVERPSLLTGIGVALTVVGVILIA